jgi:hypothetical protein
LIFLPIFISSTRLPLPPIRVTVINLKDPNYRLYLPVLFGADPPENAVAKEELKEPAPQPVKRSASPRKGFSYPGPQPILSDFPKPTNRIQTLLQPALIDPPTLPPPLTLPNIVQMPTPVPAPRLAVSILPNAFTPPELQPPPVAPPALKMIEMPVNTLVPPIDPKRPLLLTAAAQSAPDMPLPQQPPPTTASVPTSQAKDTPSSATNASQPLLALSPMPAAPADSVKIPAGEARGRFAISPQPNLTTDIEPGTKTEPVGVSTKDKDSVPAPTRGSTSPSGTDSGKRGNVFPGITILESGAGPVSTSTTGAPAPLQTSYGMMILSTEDSGGGLPRFGVFSNEQIYTVFIDMRRTINDLAPSWTLEYAVLKGSPTQTNSAAAPERNQQGIVAPFPIVKQQPVLPAELVRKYPRRQIIVYAVINVEGKMEQIAVKDSPDPLLNEPVLNALSKWSFRPAKLGGENVAVKALMGIPLSLPK